MLGADFETFMGSRGAPIADTFTGLPGKGEKPVIIDPSGIGLHRDNVMLEMTIPAVETADEMVASVSKAMIACEQWLKANFPHVTTGLSAHRAMTCHPFELEHDNAKELGCDPDWVIGEHSGEMRDALNADVMAGRRYAGAHVHISYENPTMPPYVAAMLCDLFIGLPHAHLLNRRRAEHYGLPGLHRPTKYPDGSGGVEYRALDNFWIHSLGHCKAVALGAENVQALVETADNDLLIALFRLHKENISPAVPLANLPREVTESVATQAIALGGN